MSDKKISQLTASTTPLAGTEVLPVVQSGVTKQVSVNNLTAGKAVNGLTFTANGRATIRTASIADAPSPTGNGVGIGFSGGPSIAPTDGNGNGANGSVDLGRSDIKWKDFYLAGNVVIGTAGKGIDFSADGQAAGMTSELLDDYEEGTWTPVLNNFTSTNTPTVNGIYTKVGRLVTVIFEAYELAIGDITTTSSSFISGLPFSISGIAYGVSANMTTNSGAGSATNGYSLGTNIYPGTSAASAIKYVTCSYFV